MKNGSGALKIGDKTVPEPPGRPQNAPEALGTCPGSLKKPRPKNDKFPDKKISAQEVPRGSFGVQNGGKDSKIY